MQSLPLRAVRRSRPQSWFTSRSDFGSTTRPELSMRQQVAEEIALRLLRALVLDAALAEQLARKLACVAVAANLRDAVSPQQCCEVVDHGLGRERRPHLAQWRRQQCAHHRDGRLASVKLSALPPDGSTKAE